MKKYILFALTLVLILLVAACSSETPTPEPAATQEGEVVPTEEAQPSPTPELGENDPRAILGAPDGTDSFDTAQNWTTFNNDCFQTQITGGQYVMTAKGVQGSSCWEFTWPMLHNFYLESEVVMPDSCQPEDRFGMIVRAPDNHRGYLYGLSCDGKYSLNLFDSVNTTVLVAAASNSVINTGAGQTNRMGIGVHGNEFVLFVNGVRMATVFDSTYLNAGKIGYYVRASTTTPFTVSYNELAAWTLDDSFVPPDTENPPPTTPVPPPTEGAPTVTTTTFVNVRMGPSTGYPVYFTTQPGGTGEVVGQSQNGGWYAVKLPADITPTETGWVSADYVVLSNPNNEPIPVLDPPALPPGVEFPPPDPSLPIAIAIDVANVRSGPGTQFESYGVASVGDTAQAIGINEDGSWTAVALPPTIAPDGIGWIVSYAVQVEPPNANLPVLTP